MAEQDIIARAESLLVGITPGEWYSDDYPDDIVYVRRGDPGAAVAYDIMNEHDVKFIAAAPELVRALIAEVERLRQLYDRPNASHGDAGGATLDATAPSP